MALPVLAVAGDPLPHCRSSCLVSWLRTYGNHASPSTRSPGAARLQLVCLDGQGSTPSRTVQVLELLSQERPHRQPQPPTPPAPPRRHPNAHRGDRRGRRSREIAVDRLVHFRRDVRSTWLSEAHRQVTHAAETPSHVSPQEAGQPQWNVQLILFVPTNNYDISIESKKRRTRASSRTICSATCIASFSAGWANACSRPSIFPKRGVSPQGESAGLITLKSTDEGVGIASMPIDTRSDGEDPSVHSPTAIASVTPRPGCPSDHPA